MEHGLYILEGKAVYNLNQDWGRSRQRLVAAGLLPAEGVATPGVRRTWRSVSRDVNRHKL